MGEINMKRVVALCLYLVLAAVILSEARTVWVALTDRARFEAVFPGAAGAMFYVAVLTSVCGGANAIAVWLRQKWAVLGKCRHWPLVDRTRCASRRSALFANRHLLRDARRLDLLPLVAGTLPALRLNPRALINTCVREGNSPTHAAVRHRCC